MPNGKPGDHPFTDIVAHGLPVYSPEVDGLIREIDRLGGSDQLSDALLVEYDPHKNPDLKKFEMILTQIRDRLSLAAKERGRRG